MCSVCGFVGGWDVQQSGGRPHRPWPGGNSEQCLRGQDGMGFSAEPRVTEAQFFLHLYLNEALLLVTELVGCGVIVSLRSVCLLLPAGKL